MDPVYWLINVALWLTTVGCAAGGAYLGARHALRHARTLPPRG